MPFYSIKFTVSLAVSCCLLCNSLAYANELVDEQVIVNTILNHEYLQAIENANKLQSENRILLSVDFYRGLATWHQGYQSLDQSLKEQGIKHLRKSISLLEQRKVSKLTKQLALGLSKGHTARALIENQQYITGYRMGMQAKEHIERFLSKATPATLGYADAALMQGLYEIYTNEISTKSFWLFESINYRGSREKGIKLIEAAIIGDSIFANEAMRTLLAEVSWQTPDFCRYLDAIDQTGNILPRNMDIATLRQGLFLRCGFPALALEINQGYRVLKASTPTSQEMQIKALFRIWADLGEYQKLIAYNAAESLIPFRELALANSLDISEQRDKAILIYKGLSNNGSIPEAIQSVAKVRLKYPYRAPRPTAQQQFQLMPSN